MHCVDMLFLVKAFPGTVESYRDFMTFRLLMSTCVSHKIAVVILMNFDGKVEHANVNATNVPNANEHDKTTSTPPSRYRGDISIFKLPTEIIMKIFLFVKATVASSSEVSFLAMVCREWREIAFALPEIWSSLDLSQKDCVLELLRRSDPAPLQIHAPYSWAFDEHITESIMSEVGRIRELKLEIPLDMVFCFLEVNAAASAPLLEHLELGHRQLVDVNVPSEIMDRPMPSLRVLKLVHLTLRAQPPPFPHLTSLYIYRAATSVLLSILEHSPNLEDIQIQDLFPHTPIDHSKFPLRLSHLSNLSLSATGIESSAIPANLVCPQSACICFNTWETRRVEESDLADFAKMCGLCTEIDYIELLSMNSIFCINIWSREHKKLCLRLLFLAAQNYPVLWLSLCFRLPLPSIPKISVQDFRAMTEDEWSRLLVLCAHARDFRMDSINTIPLQALVKSTAAEPLLPQVQILRISCCTITTRDGEDTSFFDALAEFLQERNRIALSVNQLIITKSNITAAVVRELAKSTEVDWDRDEGKFAERRDDSEALSATSTSESIDDTGP
ncbi:hypothetical protein AB1N83_004133 [Pleurotus pulmonarius]